MITTIVAEPQAQPDGPRTLTIDLSILRGYGTPDPDEPTLAVMAHRLHLDNQDLALTIIRFMRSANSIAMVETPNTRIVRVVETDTTYRF